jgi:hypothetical protein
MTTKQKLQKMFACKDDEFWNVKFKKNEGSYFPGTPYSGVCCTGFACRVQEKLGKDRVKVMGFDSRGNPDASVLELADGHDFAVVDGRFIVDPWIAEVESGNITTPTDETIDLKGQIVFDIEGVDSVLVRKLYGDRAKWNMVFCDTFDPFEIENEED